MELATLISFGGPIAGGLGKILLPKVADRFNKYFNPIGIDKAIKAGITAVGEWEKGLQPQDLLFFRAESDGWKNYHKYLDRLFKEPAVLRELQKPLNNSDRPDVDILVELFKREAKTYKINLVSNSLQPWVESFVKGYCEEAGIYIQFEVAKINYCRQLAKRFDDIKFAGIATAGKEVDKSDRLAEIFVMPDLEDISTVSMDWEREFWRESDGPRQAELMREQRERSLWQNLGSVKFLASQLFYRDASRNKAVLLGEPGSGKTTLMSYLAVMLARQKPEALGLAADTDWLPILIRIRDWERLPEETGLLEYVRDFAQNNLAADPLPAGFFEHWLAEGRALILLDGLDEVALVGKRDRIVKRIESFLHKYEKNWAIVTSRPAGYRRDFFRTEDFPHYELQPFDDEKIKLFIDNWYNSRVPDPLEAQRRKESLRRALEESDRIMLLARNPLLLTIIALIQRYQGRLPKERHKLYDRAVETLLINWDDYKEITSNTVLQHLNFEPDVRQLMEALAFWVHTQGSAGESKGGTVIDKDELISQLSREIKSLKGIELFEAKKEAERLVGLMRDRAGLLNEQGQDCYAFAHKTFQEYLCGRAIDYQADNEDDFEIVLGQIREHLHDAHWQEVLLLLVGQQKRKKAARAIREILNYGSEYEEWLHRDLLFAGSCLAENPPNLQPADGGLSREILQGLVELEVNDGAGNRVRDRALKILCGMKDTDFQGQALKLLKERSGDLDEQRWLKYRVALGEEEEAIAILLARLEDEDDFVRWSAAEAMGKLGKSTPKALNTLVARLEDEQYFVRWNAAQALGKLGKGTPMVLDTLVARLEDGNDYVRRSAAEALGNLGKSTPMVLDALLARLEYDNNYWVRTNAAQALGKFGKSTPRVLEALVARLEDEEYFVRWNAAQALGKLDQSTPRVLDALLARLEDGNDRVLWSAVEALGNLGHGTPRVLDTLLCAGLEHDSHRVRWNAAQALGNLGHGTPRVLDALFAGLENEDDLVRSHAAQALGKLGKSTPTILGALVARLEDEEYLVRSHAAQALGKLGKKSGDVLAAIARWIEQHQDSEYIGYGIDALWDAVVEEQS
ncbi:MAG: HEAT repeat domain-containing protein [Cyanobacteriota bacterium]|nr:HEAT repeat domain-containing protein [Cyanobacteriota bacterium]